MYHADETRQRWQEIEWAEKVCRNWEVFFSALLDEPAKAEALCALGLEFLRGEGLTWPQSGSGRWFGLFGSLIGRSEMAHRLCTLGLETLRARLEPSDEAVLRRVRAALDRRRPVV